MPYLQQADMQIIRDSGQVTGSAMAMPSACLNRSGSAADPAGKGLVRTLRTIPHDSHNGGAAQAPQSTDENGTDLKAKTSSLTDQGVITRLQCMNNIVRSQIETLYKNQPSLPTEDESFFQYTIQVDTVMFCGKYSNIYLSYHNDHPESHLMGRVFEPASKIDPQRSMYLKILKHIGKQHPSLIGTWDIFYDTNSRAVIFQEFAMHGNLQEYIKQENVFVPEEQTADWAKQIFRGLDYLGDAGICHRAINPKHILLTPSSEEANQTLVKLGSFRDAILYYDPKNGCIRNQPCRPLGKRRLANYQAPETFGSNSEEFDPIGADIWSYGATFFFVATRTYPFRYKKAVKNISADIQKTVTHAKGLSADAKHWFSGILCADATRRTMFDKIEADPWFKAF